MVKEILVTIIKYVVPLFLGICIGKIKKYKIKDKSTGNALMTLLQSNLTNTYFAYDNMKQIPDYVYRNWLNELKVYEELGGDDYVHTLAHKMEPWEITRTDILQK